MLTSSGGSLTGPHCSRKRERQPGDSAGMQTVSRLDWRCYTNPSPRYWLGFRGSQKMGREHRRRKKRKIDFREQQAFSISKCLFVCLFSCVLPDNASLLSKKSALPYFSHWLTVAVPSLWNIRHCAGFKVIAHFFTIIGICFSDSRF